MSRTARRRAQLCVSFHRPNHFTHTAVTEFIVHVRRLLSLAALAAGLAGCGQPAPQAAAPSDGLKRYPLTGEVVSADPAKNLLIVRHEEVPGVMPGMTMEFNVSPGDAAIAKPGSRIRATLVQVQEGEFRLEKIWPDDRVSKSRIEAALKDLQQDTAIRGKGAYREVGESMPAFTLYDQDGKAVDSSSFRGKRILLNFIYTRCPVATMCPAATLKMMAAQKAAKEAGLTDFQLISITFDPEFDTPGVLRTYATDRGIDTSNFSFVTGPISAVQNLMKQFGIDAIFEGGVIKHNLSTVLFDTEGRIIHRAEGSQWDPADFLNKLKRG
jgi:protein SCO1/2